MPLCIPAFMQHLVKTQETVWEQTLTGFLRYGLRPEGFRQYAVIGLLYSSVRMALSRMELPYA